MLKLALMASLVLHDPAAFIMGDGFEYQTRADTLSATGKFGSLHMDGSVSDDGYRLPGYPAFLSLLRFSDGPERVAVWSLLQLVICHAWLLLVGRWIMRRHGDSSATYFVVALSLTLPWTHYVAVVHSDFLFAVLLFSGALCLATAQEEGAAPSVPVAGAALFFGAAALTRPDLVFLPFWLALLAGAGWVWNLRFAGARGRFAAMPVLAAALGSFGAMAGWAIRNYLVIGRFTYTSVVDTVVMFFASSADKTVVGPPGSGGLLQMLDLMLQSSMKILVGFIPALAQIFFNPSRWYLHFYMHGWGLDLKSSGVPFSELGLSGLPVIEYVYMAVEVLIPLAVFAVFARFLVAFWKGRINAPQPVLVLMGALALYLVVQKGIWGVLTVGSGQRYGMSILPFIVYFGALTFACRRDERRG
ncbi:hypothetical protein CCC_01744 [Paramagnetospirillum magnetotacticum MS-1]|uniref:Glycosyltransferase RgtA/B/C/D-like domain-containing protein n=2 Tax=Paramagnetospirillum magnetotacticum TaxID=188 RepID=A0A0C2YLR9_PARME|nr:hypothetical protein CCC_01744 [Paramagnetospirillum magnetotacticum MS-1]